MKHKKIRYILLAVIALVCVSAPFVYAYKEVTALAATNVGNTPQINYKNYDEVILMQKKQKRSLKKKQPVLRLRLKLFQLNMTAFQHMYRSLMKSRMLFRLRYFKST